MNKPIDWRVFSTLWLAAIFSVAALVPYILALGLLDATRLPMPLYAVVALQLLQNGLLYAVVISLGLYLGQKVGLGSPALENWFKGRAQNSLRRTLLLSSTLGVLAGLLILYLDHFAFASVVPLGVTAAEPPAWAGFLASFYGGICEELLMRLGLMTLIVWITWLIMATPERKPTTIGVWIAILLVSLAFGAGHLPATAKLMKITPMVVSRALLLNGVIGVVCGWLFWKRGLESAVVAHFSADIILHVFAPLVKP